MLIMKKIFLSVLLITSMTLSAASNPFFKKYSTPRETIPFNLIKTEHYLPAFEEGIKQAQADIDKITSNSAEPTFENTIIALENSGELLDKTANCFFNVLYTDGNDELMELSQTVQPMLSEHSNNVSLNESLYKRVKAVYDNMDNLNLNAEQKKLLTNTYESFENSGATLSEDKKEKYRSISKELSQLSLVFAQNVQKSTNSFEMLLTSEDELAGLPESVKEAAAMAAKSKGKEGYLFTHQAPSYVPFMKYSSRRDLREKMYKSYASRALEGEFSNVDVLKRTAELRLEMAQLFGFENYATRVLRKRMAQNPENVNKLLDDLTAAYTPLAKEEMSAVQGFAVGMEGQNIDIMPWDWSYYSNKLKDARYSISDEVLRPYFPLESVKKGVFGLATELYGLKFKKNPKIQVYNEEVDAYEVFDKDGKYLAVLYTDFHPRDGKRPGAWKNDFKPQWKEGKKDSRPHVIIVMNFTRPTGDKPALLTYDEAETFLHEFGHALHGMLSDVTYASMSGTSVYRDFVELPSQILENYMGEKDFLDTFAAHYETGEKIPAELVEKIKASSNFNVGYGCLRQLTFGKLDMKFHTIEKPLDMPLFEFETLATETTQLMPAVDNTSIATAFSHIFAGGYAAGYYSYKWAEVLDADAFSVFQENGLFDKETAESFRKCILERGGTEDPMILYKNFRGQEPTIDAMMKRDGVRK